MINLCETFLPLEKVEVTAHAHANSDQIKRLSNNKFAYKKTNSVVVRIGGYFLWKIGKISHQIKSVSQIWISLTWLNLLKVVLVLG